MKTPIMCLGVILVLAGLMSVLATFIPGRGPAGETRTIGERAISLVFGLIMMAGGLTILAVRMYNALVSARLLCDKTWSNIDVLLKRRHDLIDSLAATVRRYAEHEQSTFSDVARYRSQATGTDDVAERGRAEAGLGVAMGRLLAVAESYPDLKASGNFQRLSGEWVETENAIAVSRTTYNNAAEAMNGLVRKFPSMVAARLFGYKEVRFFQADEGERVAPVASM